jgi:hypothetical protein
MKLELIAKVWNAIQARLLDTLPGLVLGTLGGIHSVAQTLVPKLPGSIIA